MSIEVYRRMILVSGLMVLLGFVNHASSQSSQAHRHIGIGKTAAVDIPEFSMVETSLEAVAKKENLITSRNKRYEAFTVSDTRLLVSDRTTAKVLEIRGLPMEWRPFSDLVWRDNQTLVFDRWSQPHYGVHYEVNVKLKKLIKAVPFPDKTTKMEFHYFENLDHSLNIGEYSVKGTLPAGHQAILEFIRQRTQ